MSALLVAIEGIDGSGKGTQAGLLQDSLGRLGMSAGLLRFPCYEQNLFGRTIARYLNGEFGGLQSSDPHFAALLYAGDRFESLPRIREQREQCDVLIFDRYVPSNLAHQAARVPEAERAEFISWVKSIEYDVYGLPQPDMVIYLDIPVAVARQLITRKPPRAYTQKAADLHEADTDYLSRTAQLYRQIAAREDQWHVVPCVEAERIRTPEVVHREILAIVRSALDHLGPGQDPEGVAGSP